ncbi:Putative HTH-type transcriptional regulator YhjB [Anaerolineae bacterium]|nr:Putative HTH-type transcriptional regulator YhjB [Anaerolineae bacterium]
MNGLNLETRALSPRQREILGLLANGLDNKTIARTLGISSKTVKNHLTFLFKKINAQSRTQAAIWAIREHVV